MPGKFLHRLRSLLVGLLLAGACSAGPDQGEMLVTLIADGSERSFLLQELGTVGSLLRDRGLEPGPLDRVEPALDSMLEDGMRITLVRIEEREACERHEISFKIVGRPASEGQTLLALRIQTGVPGEEERCYLVRLEDGVQREAIDLGRVIIREAMDEVWQKLPDADAASLDFAGTLVWLSEGNAWLARHEGGQLRQLTRDGGLDGKVLALSSDGKSLLFTRRSGLGHRDGTNQLWLLTDLDRAGQETRLTPEDLQDASWLPGSSNEFAFLSAGAATALSHVRVDPASGEILYFREFPLAAGEAETSGDTRVSWSPDGDLLAWATSDSAGFLIAGSETTTSPGDRGDRPSAGTGCTKPSLSWSPDARNLLVRLPGEDNQFDIVVMDVSGNFSVALVRNSGPCSQAAFSPRQMTGQLAFLQARNAEESQTGGGHNLMTVDRDGSNRERLFPAAGQAGLAAQDLVWSPDGRHLALVYGGQLLLFDVAGREAQPFPFPGIVTSVVWSN